MKKFFSTMLFFSLILMTSTISAKSNYVEEVLYYCNVEREKVGIAPLEIDYVVNECADIRAEEIVQKFSHTRPDDIPFYTILRGYPYNTCGENIAAGYPSAEETVNQWMNSEGHRKNILNPAFKKLGVGYCYAENSTYKHYWVQIFIG